MSWQIDFVMTITELMHNKSTIMTAIMLGSMLATREPLVAFSVALQSVERMSPRMESGSISSIV